jgi:hypothetical protein
MKGRVYKRGMSWYYRFDIEPDPLTGKRRQVNGSGYRTEREAACPAPPRPQWSGRRRRSARPRWTGPQAGRFPGQHQQPPRGLAGFHPPCAFPSAGKNPRAILAAQSQVSLNLAPPAGQTRGIGERRPHGFDISIKAVLHAHDALAICGSQSAQEPDTRACVTSHLVSLREFRSFDQRASTAVAGP